MYLAYSALRDEPIGKPITTPSHVKRRLQLRYRGYHAACQKYEREIAAIQQYLPGWQPAFR